MLKKAMLDTFVSVRGTEILVYGILGAWALVLTYKFFTLGY